MASSSNSDDLMIKETLRDITGYILRGRIDLTNHALTTENERLLVVINHTLKKADAQLHHLEDFSENPIRLPSLELENLLHEGYEVFFLASRRFKYLSMKVDHEIAPVVRSGRVKILMAAVLCHVLHDQIKVLVPPAAAGDEGHQGDEAESKEGARSKKKKEKKKQLKEKRVLFFQPLNHHHRRHITGPRPDHQ